jgi:hypothetical protein
MNRGLFPTLNISRKRWVAIWILGTITGVLSYCALVADRYDAAQSTMLQAGADFMRPWPMKIDSTPLTAATLSRFGITDEKLDTELAGAIDKAGAEHPDATQQGPTRLPLLAISSHLLLDTRTQSCQSCEQVCRSALEPVLARLLLGWPGSLESEVAVLREIFQPQPPVKKDTVEADAKKAIEAACSALRQLQSRSAWSDSYQLIWNRVEPWRAPMLAEAIEGAGSCLQTEQDTHKKNTCTLLTKLFEAILDDESVRHRRAFGVNFFYGWERALVFVLAWVTIFALIHQEFARRRLEEQADWANQKLNTIDNDLNPYTGVPQATRQIHATQLREDFLQEFGSRNTQEGDWQEPIAEMIDGLAASPPVPNAKYLKSLVDLNLLEIDHSREVMNTIITLFPVVGFGATLLSLVQALAGANEIATASGDVRSAAILDVTAMLSSAFSTTFMALFCMAVFAVFNMMQGGSDRRLVLMFQERLITVFRP